MNLIFETGLFNRKVLKNLLDELNYDQLTNIPDNFNNSIFWNIAHVLVTQQLLVYGLSGLPMLIGDKIVEKYRKGTKATTNISKEEIDYVKKNLISTLERTQKDFQNSVFKKYNPYHTSVNITLNNIDDALKFNAFHDGIHLGVILSLKKIV
ncbi:MAG: DinB family protein [Mycoplasmataceae bacterium]|nr:DinB family protein [Mycoplasmataceae bacterium]